LVGEPIVHALLVSRGRSAAASGFGLDLLLLAPWLLATLGLWAVMPAVLVRLNRPGAIRVRWPIVALLALHMLAILIGRALAGYHGVIVAMFVAPAAFTIAGLRAVCPPAGPDLIRDGAIIVGAGLLAFGGPALLAGAVSGGGLPAGAAALAVGLVLYAVLTMRAYPNLPLPFPGAARR
jgi:hypothetical protein